LQSWYAASNTRLVVFGAIVGVATAPEVKYFTLRYSVGNPLTVRVVDNDERVLVVWRWIGTQRVVVYPERFAVVGEPLNCLCNVSTGTVARTIIG
jgi:hypothetical protein